MDNIYFIKHRPKLLTELVYNKNLYAKINKISLFNNLIFYGAPGVGKYTMCNLYLSSVFNNTIYKLEESSYKLANKNIIKYYHSHHHFEFDIRNYLNKDDKLVSELIKTLCSTYSIHTGKSKVIVFRNADHLKYKTQAMLRRIIETGNARFILITSNLEKIIDPLQSRCWSIRIPPPSSKEITTLLRRIAKKEGFKISKRNLDIIKKKSKSPKELIALLQMCYNNGKFRNKDFSYVTIVKTILKLLPQLNKVNYKKFKLLIYDVYTNDLDFIKFIKYIVNNDKELDNKGKFKLVEYAAECDMNIQLGNKPPIHFEKFIMQYYYLLRSNKKQQKKIKVKEI